MNKQIEEMAKIAGDAIDNQFKGDCPYTPCPFLNNKSVSCDTCIVLYILYENGYRKQSEGEWVKKYEKAPRYVCTACNHLFNNKEYKFCPNCGSKMKGGES